MHKVFLLISQALFILIHVIIRIFSKEMHQLLKIHQKQRYLFNNKFLQSFACSKSRQITTIQVSSLAAKSIKDAFISIKSPSGMPTQKGGCENCCFGRLSKNISDCQAGICSDTTKLTGRFIKEILPLSYTYHHEFLVVLQIPSPVKRMLAHTWGIC